MRRGQTDSETLGGVAILDSSEAEAMTGAHQRPRGFTLIECLVVISIIGVLVALLIPAVQSVRAAARRGQCAHHLGQLGLALQSYQSALSVFPHGGNGHGYSIHVMLLPYLEQGPLYASINIALGPDTTRSHPNWTAAATQLDSLLCPADTPPHGHNGWNSYPGCVGYGYQAHGDNGIFTFPPAGPTRPRDVRDGLSQTIAMTEWVLGQGGRKEVENIRAVLVTNPPREKPDQLDDFIRACAGADLTNSPSAQIGKGRNWMVGVLGSSLSNNTMPINAPSCVNGGLVREGALTVGSFHEGRTNVLFADGHVAAYKDSTPLRIWQALSSRGGQELIGDPAG